jgi:hypothetical protein
MAIKRQFHQVLSALFSALLLCCGADIGAEEIATVDSGGTIDYTASSTDDSGATTTDGGGISGSFFTSTPAETLELAISEIHVDFENKNIEISGAYFDLGLGPLQVTLGHIGDISSSCALNTASVPQTITCDFWSSGLPPDGDYLVRVSTGAGQSDEYNLTIGAVGPPGDTGPQGIQGPPGPPNTDAETMVRDAQGAICELYAQLALAPAPAFCDSPE